MLKNAPKNKIYHADNLKQMRQIPSDSVQLIYLDPSFYNSLKGKTIFGNDNPELKKLYGNGRTIYFETIGRLLVEAKRILTPTGSIVFQTNHTAENQIGIMLQEIFGSSNFKNKIIWQDSDHKDGSATKILTRSYETLFWYSKSSKAEVYIKAISELRTLEEMKKKYNRVDDQGRMYTTRSLLRKPKRTHTASEKQAFKFKGYDAKKNGTRWLWKREKIIAADERGDFIFSNTGKPECKCYPEEDKGTPPSDIWQDIKPVYGKKDSYPTQKPEELLERIIKLTTLPGDIVLDPYLGSGTTIAVAKKLKRNFIGIDVTREAVIHSAERINYTKKLTLTKITLAEAIIEIVDELARKHITSETSRKLAARSGNKCEICGATLEDMGVLHRHHILSHRWDSSLENLIHVCMGCHGKIHSKKSLKLENCHTVQDLKKAVH